MQPIKKILCATDLSNGSQPLLSKGVALCSQFDAVFLVFHAVPPPRGSIARQIEFERGGEKKEKIETARKTIKKIMADFDIKWESIITYGDPVLEMEKTAKKIAPDIVMAESYGLSGFQQFFIGSIVGRMAQRILQPLLVIPPEKMVSGTGRPGLQFSHIMIACSLLETDRCLKEYALVFYEMFDSRVCLAHVMESPVNEDVVESTSEPYEAGQRHLEEKLSFKLKKIMPGETLVLRGSPGEELALHAKKHGVELIIAGVEDRPGRIISTTTAELLRHLPCAVLTVPVKTKNRAHKI